MTTQLWTTTPTANDDFLIGIGGASTIDGGDGDDYMLGDSITPFGLGTNISPTSPFNIDSSSKWTTDENPFITDPTIPHTTLYVAPTAGQKQYASVTIGAGETITIDIDFGTNVIGGNVDTMVRLLDSGGIAVADNDDSPLALDPGTQNGWDSYLTYTNTTGSTQTFTIVFQQFGTSNNTFTADTDFIANISVTGHAATGSVSPGNDVLSGGNGDDMIAGQGGNDTLSGGAGNDTLFGGTGDDVMNGNAGIDTASYADAASAVAVNLSLTAAQNTGGAGTDQLLSVENLIGSAYSDFLYGNATYNQIRGGTGDDTIYGYDGNDTLRGDAGNDTLNGGAGNDFLYADPNNLTPGYSNVLIGGTGNDLLSSGLGADTLQGNDGADRITDSGGDDIIQGGAGIDLLDYSAANSSAVTVNLATTTAQDTGGAGIDTITGVENLIGTQFSDTLTGNGGANVIEGWYGDDTINGGAGIDTASYQLGGAVIVSLDLATAQDTVGAGNDTLTSIENLLGSNYDDELTGNNGVNRLDGSFGNDLLFGLGGGDTLIGGEGDDTLNGGAGNDTLNGGNGNDAASYIGATAGVNVDLTVAGAQVTGGAGSDTLTSIENLFGSAFNDTLHGNSANNILDGFGGSDTLTGGGGADIFRFDAIEVNNFDTVTDFQVGTDKIGVISAIAGGSPPGALPANLFFAGTAAHDPDDRIIYDQATGNIYWDGDGNGDVAQILIAQVTPGLALTISDFQVL
jgi:Ca2+-binding RTX toxin-like protein